MPFIYIKSLPDQTTGEISEIVSGISSDFAHHNSIAIEHVHVVWELLTPGHYAKGAHASVDSTGFSHPVLVDLLTPDFIDNESVKLMLTTLAESMAERAGIPINKIFINHRAAHSGHVFDDGEIVCWE